MCNADYTKRVIVKSEASQAREGNYIPHMNKLTKFVGNLLQGGFMLKDDIGTILGDPDQYIETGFRTVNKQPDTGELSDEQIDFHIDLLIAGMTFGPDVCCDRNKLVTATDVLEQLESEVIDVTLLLLLRGKHELAHEMIKEAFYKEASEQIRDAHGH